jgi:hypothetical protein
VLYFFKGGKITMPCKSGKAKSSKRGQVGGIQTFVISIIGVAVVIAVGLMVLSELKGSMDTEPCGTNATYDGLNCVNTTSNYDATAMVLQGNTAFNSTGAMYAKMEGIPTWIGIIITVALAFIVLGFFFAGKKQNY